MKRNDGFSLIEFVICLAITGVLFVAAAPYITEIRETSKASAMKISYDAIADATFRYNQDTAGIWPSSLSDLMKDPVVAGWAGPYLSHSHASNPWGGGITLKKDATVTFKVGTGLNTTDTQGDVLYLELAGVNNIAAKKLDTAIDDGYDIAIGHCQVTDSLDGTSVVKILIYDTP